MKLNEINASKGKIYKLEKGTNFSSLRTVSMIPSNPQGLLDVYLLSGGILWKTL